MASIFVHEIEIGFGSTFSTGAIRVPGVIVEPRIHDPGLVRQSVFSAGRLPGVLVTSIGDAVYINTDGSLDIWGSLPISGKKLTCWYGPDTGVFPDDFEIDFVAYIHGVPRFTRDPSGVDYCTISLQDRTSLFGGAAVPRGFLQTGDLEGTEVAGSRKRQRFYGDDPGIPAPILIDPFEGGNNVYYVMQSLPVGALLFYDGGVAIAEATSPYASSADLFDPDEAPDPGEWRRWSDDDEGFFVRFGSRIVVDLRCDIQGADGTISDLAIEAGVADAGSMAADSVDLDIGSRVVETQTVDAVFADVARQNLSIIGFNRADEFMQRTLAPSTVATYETDVVLVDGENCDEFEVAAPGGFERRVWKVTVRSGATQAGTLAGIPDLSFGAAETVVRDRWIAEFSGISQETRDEDSTAEHIEIEIEANAFAGALAAMLAYVEDVLAMFAGVALWYWVTAPYSEADIRALQLLDRLLVRAGGRFNTGSGRWARVHSIERRLAATEGNEPTIRLGLWAHYTEPDDVELVEVNDAYAATSYSSKALKDRTRRPESFVISCSDLETNIEEGLLQHIEPWPYDYRLAYVEAGLLDAQPAGSVFAIDVQVDSVSIFSTLLTIDNTETTSATAATPAVLSTFQIPAGSAVDIYADQVGTAGAHGLKVNFVGFQ